MTCRSSILILFLAAWCGAAEYYVATDGNNANAGTAVKPLRTITAAVDRMLPGDKCTVRQGIYCETVKITTDKVKLATEGTVLVSAADPVLGWTRHEGSVWKAPVSGALGAGENQVFVRGKWYDEARWPNVDEWEVRSCAAREATRPNRCGDIEGFDATWYAKNRNDNSVLAPSFVNGWMDNLKEDVHDGWPTTDGMCKIGITGHGKEQTSPTQNPYNILYGKPRDYWKGVVIFCLGWWWSASGIVGASYDGTNQYLGDATFFEVLTPRIRWSGQFILIGHTHFIDRPGEWAVKDSMLYMWIPDGIDPESGDIMLKKRYHTFDFAKRKNIELQGFHSIGGQVQMDSASYCTFDDCHFYSLNHTWLVYYGSDVSATEKTGKTGILFSGDNNTFQNGSVVYAAGSAFVFYGKNNKVINSYVTDIDYPNTYSAPILMQGDPQTSLVTRTTFMRAGRSILGGFKSAVLTYNKLYDGMMLSGDGGTLYSVVGGLVRADDTEVAYNWFRGCYGEPSTYIYSDWGCPLGMKVHHNVFFPNSPSEGKFIPEATCGMFFYNNTWAAKVNQRDWLFATKDSIYQDSTWDKREWVNNLNAGVDNLAFWRFTDTLKGDFTLAAGSPAIDSGVVIPGFTDAEGGYSGASPDLGAYEYGTAPWAPGHDWGAPLIEEDLWQALGRGSAINAVAVRAGNTGAAVLRTAHGWAIRAPREHTLNVRLITSAGRTTLSRHITPGCAMEVASGDLGRGVYLLQIGGHGIAMTQRLVVGAR